MIALYSLDKVFYAVSSDRAIQVTLLSFFHAETKEFVEMNGYTNGLVAHSASTPYPETAANEAGSSSGYMVNGFSR